MKKRFILPLILLAFTALHLQAAENYGHLIEKARQAKYSKDYDEALKYYEKAYNTAKTMRSKFTALNESGNMLMDKKDYSGAERKFRKILSSHQMKNNEKATALLRLGDIKLAQGNERGAENDYQKALHHDPTGEMHQTVLVHYASLLYKQEKYDKAQELLKKAVRIYVNPHHSHGTIGNAKLLLARIAVVQKRYGDAHRYYSEVTHVRNVPPWAASSAFQEKAEKVLFPQKKYWEVRTCLKEAEESIAFPHWMKKWIPDTRATSYLLEAESKANQMKHEEAEELLASAKKVPNITPKIKKNCERMEGVIMLSRGRDQKRQKHYDEAAEIFLKTLKKPNKEIKFSAYIELGYLHLLQRHFSNAKKYFAAAEKIPGLTPDQKVHSMIAFADHYMNQKRNDTALEYLGKPYPEDKVSPAVLARLYGKFAAVHFANKDMDKAAEFCRKTLEIEGIPASVKREVENIQKKISKD